jgi:hypothetical protein
MEQETDADFLARANEAARNAGVIDMMKAYGFWHEINDMTVTAQALLTPQMGTTSSATNSKAG